MKKFLLLTSSFLFCCLIIIFTIIIFSSKIISNRASFKISKSYKYVIVGQSVAECAYNDSLIDNFFNFSQSGESYFYNYFKIKQLLESNSHIQTVFVEYSNNQIEKIMDDWIWGTQYIYFRYPKFAPFMEYEDLFLLGNKNAKDFMKIQNILIKKNSGYILHRNFDFISAKELGGFIALNIDNPNIQSPMMFAFPKEKEIEVQTSKGEISENNINYLEKIIQLCKRKNVNVVLIRSPLNEKNEFLYNERIHMQILHKRFSTIDFLDFKDFPLLKSDYAGTLHLNYRGAKKFSIFFNKLLKNGLLDKQNKQKFINNEMNKIRLNAQ